jgi:outer membrane protein insertion porin family
MGGATLLNLSCWAGLLATGALGQIVSDIRVEGLQHTSREFVLQQLASKAGESDSEAKRRLDFLYLDRLGIFSSIHIEAENQAEGVVLHVILHETLPFAPYVSVTTTEDNGMTAGPAFNFINLWGRAYSANVAVEFGDNTNVYLRFASPLLARSPWSYSAGFARALRDNPEFHFGETSITTDAILQFQFRPDLRLFSHVTVLALSADRPGITLNPSGHDVIPTLFTELRYDSRDSWTNPLQGWFIGLGASRNGFGGGPAGWWMGQLDMRRYQRIAERHTVALFSLLSLQTGRPGVDLPVYMTYGIGGTNTVRGWPVGAREGKNQWLNTLEYRYQLVKPHPIRLFGRFNAYWGLHIAAYGDLGTAWTDQVDFTRDFIGSGGYGVRLMVPYIGMIRFDRAYGRGLRPAYGLGERADLWRERIR